MGTVPCRLRSAGMCLSRPLVVLCVQEFRHFRVVSPNCTCYLKKNVGVWRLGQFARERPRYIATRHSPRKCTEFELFD